MEAPSTPERVARPSVAALDNILGQLLPVLDDGFVRVIDYLLGYAFPGVSGFKYERRPPHRVEGGACVPHGEAQERLWKLGDGSLSDSEAVLEHCRACARALVAALQDLKFTRPEEIQGLL